jgi:hypothetical protein
MSSNDKQFNNSCRNNCIFVLIISSFHFANTTSIRKRSSGVGYDDGREDRVDGNSYNDYCSPSLNDDIGCGAYKVRYSLGWNAAGLLYGGQDNSRDYEEPGEYYNNYDDDDE